MASAQDPWSNIPLDIAGLVLKRLPALVDRVRFAAVCPSAVPPRGRSSFSLHCHFSLSRMETSSTACPGVSRSIFLASETATLMAAEKASTQLVVTGWSTDGCSTCSCWIPSLVPPSAGATMTLPPPDSFVSTGISEKLFMEVKYSQMIKLMVCSPNLIAVLFQGEESNRIAVYRPGGSKWSVARKLCLWITDMAFYQGNLYVVDYHEDLLALDISVDDKTGDPRVSQIVRVINVNQFDDDRTLLRVLYLVESRDSLLLVCRRIFHMRVHDDGQIHTFAGQCEPDLSIFEADFVQSQWVKVPTLADNLALFLGPCLRVVCLPQCGSWITTRTFTFGVSIVGLLTPAGCQTPSLSRLCRWSRGSATMEMQVQHGSSLQTDAVCWKRYHGNAGAAWIFPAN